ncbi:ribonuclease R [Haladaptatus sp. F3-133]|jgi:ribonuclease R|uniref:Ribonuclease R n=1 Tax=Halorutilus salinus TaxID=2487751 RepID=A0A9Q4GJL0_9EURY|nr:ribonuclease R family protein [Halorutilus salinus]MCX2819336.1 ribonuclease R [Halorutilus salinus]
MSEEAKTDAETEEKEDKIDDEERERMEAELDEIKEEYDIPKAFPKEARAEVERITDGFRDEIAEGGDDRVDLRALTTFTCDPKRAQDFDDAITINETEDGWRLWVHIADVSHYVTPDTELYDEAKRRASTVYFPGHTVHMLPPDLAETVCSLVPDEERFAHTVEMLINESYSFENIDIYKSVIESDRRLTYTEAETVLDGDGSDVTDAVAESLRSAYELAEGLHETRKEDGSLVLNPARDRAHTIVEECMLKANKAVTQELMWNRGVEAMYRVHPQPTPEQWSEALEEIQNIGGVSISAENWDKPRHAVNNAIEDASETDLRKIQRAVLHVMPRAKYMSDPFGGHYALNFDIYGHFTSPIRRIADLVNHRIVHENDVPDDLQALADHASDRQMDAESAERDFKKFLEELGYDPHEVEDYKLG